MSKTVIIDYKAGNVQSLLFAIEKLNFSAKLTNDPDEISKADKVIFPGVGEASFAMNSLKETGLDLLIPELKQPLLGICLGMQLLCRDSEESATKALGIFDVSVKKFPDSVLVPQIGWNQIYFKIFPSKPTRIWCTVITQKKTKIRLPQPIIPKLTARLCKKIIFSAFSFIPKKVASWEAKY